MADRDAFLRWCCANPYAEEVREAYLHWLVLHALELEPKPGQVRHEQPWRDQLIALRDLTLALSSAAYIQHPEQQQPQSISFKLWAFQADYQVLGLLEGSTPQSLQGLDLFDVTQWRFWVVPSRDLHPDRRSIGLNPLRRSHGEGLVYGELPAHLERLWQEKTPSCDGV